MDLASTRRALHAVAEYVLAGPQYRASGDIRLAVTPGGFGTVADPDVRVDGAQVVAGDRRVAITAVSATALGEALGVPASSLDEVYHDGSHVGLDETLDVDGEQAAYLARCFAAGDTALRRLAPQETPVLWPEHFDIGITLDEINYGVSPGDSFLAEPYAYVGPWQTRNGEFWNAPFGAARPLGATPDAAEIEAFFREGQRAAAQ